MEKNILRVLPKSQASYYAEQAASSRSPLLLLDCQRVRDQYARLKKALPNVKLYYAVKSCPHPAIIHTLRDLGAGFDIASSGEAQLMSESYVFPRSCIHTHPIKNDSEIRAALRMGCTTFVVDNIDELDKLVEYKSRVGLLLRVSFRHPLVKVDLSKKFGCSMQQLPLIVERANELGLHIKGLSFHAGSQCSDATKHVEAIEACSKFIIEANESGLSSMHVLDIGGGFPVNYEDARLEADNIHSFCKPIRKALAGLPSFIRVIAEPGRYLSAPCMSAVSTVIGKANRDGRIWYYLNDGVYGSYSGQLFDHTQYPITVFSDSEETLASVLSGPTCDSIDVIAEDVQLPELNIGDVILGQMMGAYTWATSTNFNSLPSLEVRVLNQIDSSVSSSKDAQKSA